MPSAPPASLPRLPTTPIVICKTGDCPRSVREFPVCLAVPPQGQPTMSTPDADKDAEFRRKWREVTSDQTLTEKEKAARLQDLQRARTAAPNAAAPAQTTPGTRAENTACLACLA